jgi:hypothetical protein
MVGWMAGLYDGDHWLFLQFGFQKQMVLRAAFSISLLETINELAGTFKMETIITTLNDLLDPFEGFFHKQWFATVNR